LVFQVTTTTIFDIMEILSERLGVSKGLLWHAYSLARRGNGYTTFEIPKRSGGSRKIHKPVESLLWVQRLIKLHILDDAPAPADCVTAFRKGRSIADNARVHCDKSVLVKFDLKDFFPSISFTRVTGIFKSLGFNEREAKGLAYLTTIQLDSIEESPSVLLHYERLRAQEISEAYVEHLRHEARQKRSALEHGIDFGDLGWEANELFDDAKRIENDCRQKQLKRRGLPQGAPTSPQLANLAGMRLDARLSGLAKLLGFQYTRYADDLTFSSNDPRAKTNALARLVAKIVKESGFEMNPTKTCFMRAPATRQTTGLVVNDTVPRVRRRTIRKVRAMLHQKKMGKLEGNQTYKLAGFLSFIRMINPEQADRLEEDRSVPT